MKYWILTSLILTVACSNAEFAAEQTTRKPAASPAAPQDPIPDGEPIPITPAPTPGPQWQTVPPIPTTPPQSSGPSFWDQAQQWFQGLDFNNGFEFGEFSRSFHIGNGEFSSSSECSTRLSFRALSGRVFKFQFQVTQPNTTVNIKIDKICGVDRSNNFTTMYAGSQEMQQYRRNLSPGQDDFEFQQMVLQPGWYEIRVVSPDYDLNGRNDPDDFLVGKVKVRADKQVNKGDVLAEG